MDNKQIQDQRMRGYFIDSAKNLIKGEGLRSISARHVSDHAGYSYATLYNYFKDINELIFRCVEDFSLEAAEFIEAKAAGAEPGREHIKAIASAYVAYFIEYPGVYELFFLERMGNFGNRQQTADLITGLLSRLCEEDFALCIREGIYTPDEAMQVCERLNYALAGILLLYENRLHPATYSGFTETVSKHIDSIVA